MYAGGTGVTKDYAEAARWLMKAARRGQTAAREKLLILREQLEAESWRSSLRPRTQVDREPGDF
jgi:TPR repeat protein